MDERATDMSNIQPLARRRSVGRFTVHALWAGGLKLDGGAMFGIVPKPLWERRAPADERNRIQMGMRCLLVEHDDGLVLVDTGAGNKEDPKFYEIYGVENGGAGGRTRLEDAIVAAGFRPDDIAVVVNSHLHFDHAGGNTYRDERGAVRLAFPNARYVAHAGEYHYATHTNERTAGSYFRHNFVPAVEAGRCDLVDGTRDVVPGIRYLPTPGHTPHHQSVLIDGGNGERACFVADVIPTTAHLPLAWIMGYDVEPLVTLESKRSLLARAAAEAWLLVFEHDAAVAWGRVRPEGQGYALVIEEAAGALDAPARRA